MNIGVILPLVAPPRYDEAHTHTLFASLLTCGQSQQDLRQMMKQFWHFEQTVILYDVD